MGIFLVKNPPPSCFKFPGQIFLQNKTVKAIIEVNHWLRVRPSLNNRVLACWSIKTSDINSYDILQNVSRTYLLNENFRFQWDHNVRRWIFYHRDMESERLRMVNGYRRRSIEYGRTRFHFCQYKHSENYQFGDDMELIWR